MWGDIMANSKKILDVHEIETSKEVQEVSEKVYKEVPKVSKPTFTKEQILSSQKYKHRKDVVNVVLKDEKYTLDEVDTLIEKFMKKEVK